MQVTKEQVDPCTVALDIQVDPETIARAFDKAYRDFGRVTNVPGFRPGKAPRPILERYVDRDRVRERVAQSVATKAYQEALREENITPYGEPEVEFSDLAEGEPWQFKAVVPMPPKVTLGDLSAISVERPVYLVTDADVDGAVESLRDEHARLQPVEDRGVQPGDTAIAEMRISMEGEDPDQNEAKRSLIRVGNNIPGFDDAIAGQKPGEERSFDLTFPEDYDDADRAGKSAHFDVKISSIAESIKPELADEWVRQVSPYATVDELRAAVRTSREADMKGLADRVAESRIVEALAASSQIEFPALMAEEEAHEELDRMRRDLERRSTSYEDYLASIGQTEEEHHAALHKAAEDRVRTTLVLRELAREHGISVNDEEVDAEFAKLVEGSDEADAQLRRLTRDESRRSQMANALVRRKLRDLMFSEAKVTDVPVTPEP